MTIRTKTRRKLLRGKPGRRQNVTLREVIRNTARELFAKEGYESVSMRRIGTEIGCSPMAMYRHFASKEELLLSICEETFTEMLRIIDAGRQTLDPPLLRLRRCVRTIIDFHVSHPNHYKVTFLTEVPPGPIAERKMAIAQRSLDRLREGVRECAEARGLAVDVEVTAQIIRAAMHGMATLLILKLDPPRDPERLKQELIATVTRPLE
ncbi:MAG TPA: TetR/AcrR family transcriptional regulator [Verrucomicrobiae bacterium]|jgi:AcrR family transcriptional regulator|nr:TetR/AcrR family transcriptional regulator [Verrucomicrobiae bacterium]